MKKQKLILHVIVLVICLLIKYFLPGTDPGLISRVISDVPKDGCFICGSRPDCLISRYSQRDSVGIVYWNQPDMNDTGVRAFDDSGNELFAQGAIHLRSFSYGKDHGTISLTENPDCGISHVTVHYTGADTADIGRLKSILCQKCLDKAAGFYTDQKNHGTASSSGTTGFCLIDFKTRELYALSDPCRGYSIRDYYVSFFINECPVKENAGITDGVMDILIFYAPRREP